MTVLLRRPLTIVTRPESVQRRVEEYLRFPGRPVYIDTETTGTNYRRDRLVTLQFMQEGGWPYIVDVRHTDLLYMGKVLCPLFESDILFVGANLAFDYHFLREKMGLRLRHVFDCMLAEQVIHGVGFSEARGLGLGLSLEAMCNRRGIPISKEERNWFIGLDQRPDWNTFFPSEQVAYIARDVEVLQALHHDQVEVVTQGGLLSCVETEMQLLPVKCETERAGMRIIVPQWMEVIHSKEEEAAQLEEELIVELGTHILKARVSRRDTQWEVYREWKAARDAYQRAIEEEQPFALSGMGKKDYTASIKALVTQWEEAHPRPKKPAGKDPLTPAMQNALPPEGTGLVNIASPAQLLSAFQEMGIPASDTSSKTLEVLKGEYPLIEKLLRFRKAHKFVTSFGESLMEKIDPATGRLHPTYIQIGAATGRMSCVNPNLQQLPHRGTDAEALRQAVQAEEGHVLLTADYSSQELYVLAHLSQDENLRGILESGRDMHSETARMMFNLAEGIDPKTYEIAPGISARSGAKACTYGVVYGISPYGLAQQLHIHRDKAQELIDAWFTPFPGVRRYLEQQKRLGVRDLRSVCLGGWVRHYAPIGPEPTRPYRATPEQWADYQKRLRAWRSVRGELERKAMNTPIQGAAASITKRALIAFWDMVSDIVEEVAIIAIVHDEIVVECRKEDGEQVAVLLREAMWKAMQDALPSVECPRPEVHIGTDWRH